MKPENRQQKTKKKLSGLCSVEKHCGGCQYLALSYEEQLKKKQAQADALFSGFVKVKPILGMEEPNYYRNKVHHAFGRGKGGEIISGSYSADSHWILNAENCLLEDRECQKIMATIRRLAKSFRLKIYDEDRGDGLLRHVLVRRGFATGEILVVLVLSSQILPGKNNFIKALRAEHPQIKSIVINVNDKDTSMVLGERNITIFGPGFIRDQLCGCTFRISPASFYQINPVQTERLYRTAIQYADLKGKETVIDAYCGIGTIGLTAAAKAKKVIGVELNEDAVKDALINAKENKIENAEFHVGDASEFLHEMAEAGEHADVIFMDPPRSGSTELFLKAAVKMAPSRIVYVSCGPDTLKRDLKFLTAKGYRVLKLQPVDMFPHTVHVETVCLLSKLSEAKNHINVRVDMDEMDVMAAESKATYQEIQEWVKEKYGFHVTHLNIAQVKRKHGIIERENYNKPKSEDSRQPRCPEEKEQAIKEALKHFQMIV